MPVVGKGDTAGAPQSSAHDCDDSPPMHTPSPQAETGASVGVVDGTDDGVAEEDGSTEGVGSGVGKGVGSGARVASGVASSVGKGVGTVGKGVGETEGEADGSGNMEGDGSGVAVVGAAAAGTLHVIPERTSQESPLQQAGPNGLAQLEPSVRQVNEDWAAPGYTYSLNPAGTSTGFAEATLGILD